MAGIDPVSILLDLGSSLIKRVWPDPEAQARAELELFKMKQEGVLAALAADTTLATKQLEINAVEAANPSLFVSGWRPGLGWTCVAAFFCKYLGGPLVFVAAQFGGKHIELPPIDMTEMLPILLGMLGLAGMRTFEKIKNA